MNAEEFKRVFGYNPTGNDLLIVNCPEAGDIGHRSCGICFIHHKPMNDCYKCNKARTSFVPPTPRLL